MACLGLDGWGLNDSAVVARLPCPLKIRGSKSTLCHDVTVMFSNLACSSAIVRGEVELNKAYQTWRRLKAFFRISNLSLVFQRLCVTYRSRINLYFKSELISDCACLPSYGSFLADNNECSGVLCQNGGTCRDEIGRYSCQCLPGFTGQNCQTGTALLGYRKLWTYWNLSRWHSHVINAIQLWHEDKSLRGSELNYFRSCLVLVVLQSNFKAVAGTSKHEILWMRTKHWHFW